MWQRRDRGRRVTGILVTTSADTHNTLTANMLLWILTERWIWRQCMSMPGLSAKHVGWDYNISNWMLWSWRQAAVTPEQVITDSPGMVRCPVQAGVLTWPLVITLHSLASNRICQLCLMIQCHIIQQSARVNCSECAPNDVWNFSIELEFWYLQAKPHNLQGLWRLCGAECG